jgi:hypothetical protein
MKKVDHGAAHAFPPSPKNADNSSHWLLISTRSFTGKRGLLLLRTAGRSDICTAHEGQYTSSVPQVRIHNPPHLSQYFSSIRTISKSSIIWMIASVAMNSLKVQMKKALCRLLGHRARFSYGEPVEVI